MKNQILSTIYHNNNSNYYYDKIKNIYGSSLISYWPLNETSGVKMTDVNKNASNGIYSNVALCNKINNNNKMSPLFNGTTSYSNLTLSGLANTFNNSEGTISASFRVSDLSVWSDSTTRTLMWIFVDGNNRIMIRKESTAGNFVFYYIAGGTVVVINTTVAESNSGVFSTLWIDVAFTWSKTANQMIFYLNGIRVGSIQTGLGTWVGTPTSIYISADSSVPAHTWNGWLSNVAIGNRALSANDIYDLSVAKQRIIFDGDSRTAKMWPDDVYNNYGKQAGIRNVAISGEAVRTMITAAPTNVDPFYKSRGIVSIWGGVNDAVDPADAATIYSRLQTYCLARRALGWKTIVCSEIDAQDAARNAVNWHTVIWPALNALLNTDHSFADGYANLGADSRLQNALDTTYFLADKVHLTTAGYAVVTSIVSPQVIALGI